MCELLFIDRTVRVELRWSGRFDFSREGGACLVRPPQPLPTNVCFFPLVVGRIDLVLVGEVAA